MSVGSTASNTSSATSTPAALLAQRGALGRVRPLREADRTISRKWVRSSGERLHPGIAILAREAIQDRESVNQHHTPDPDPEHTVG